MNDKPTPLKADDKACAGFRKCLVIGDIIELKEKRKQHYGPYYAVPGTRARVVGWKMPPGQYPPKIPYLLVDLEWLELTAQNDGFYRIEDFSYVRTPVEGISPIFKPGMRVKVTGHDASRLKFDFLSFMKGKLCTVKRVTCLEGEAYGCEGDCLKCQMEYIRLEESNEMYWRGIELTPEVGDDLKSQIIFQKIQTEMMSEPDLKKKFVYGVWDGVIVKKGGEQMHECIANAFEKTKDALLVQKYHGHELGDNFINELILRQYKQEILEEVWRRKEEDEAIEG